jgi:ABC-type multidrug transport system ATPase subunit
MIEVKNISKRYRNTVLDDISFTAEKGQCIGIIGANGCGKTTLLSIMAGVNKTQSGKIYYNNELADSILLMYHRKIHLLMNLLQRTIYFCGLAVIEK